ncbi:MAG: hypothetical protein DDT20_01858 [Firmicutes bacterium]|nr:hypothetical protein [Bacillota bacterium]
MGGVASYLPLWQVHGIRNTKPCITRRRVFDDVACIGSKYVLDADAAGSCAVNPALALKASNAVISVVASWGSLKPLSILVLPESCILCLGKRVTPFDDVTEEAVAGRAGVVEDVVVVSGELTTDCLCASRALAVYPNDVV